MIEMVNMDDKTFGRRLAEARKKCGMTQQQLANALDVHVTTIAKIETGTRKPSFELLLKMAQVLNVSMDYLLGFVDHPQEQSKNAQIYPEEEFKEIPVYNGARAGNEGTYPDGSTIIDYVRISKDIPGEFGVKVFGDSMEPEIYDGDIVIVNPNLAYTNGDRIVVVLGDPYFIEPAAVVKIYREQNDIKYLQSLNERYAPIILADNVCVHFVGKVVGLVRKY